jgi:hypothetical protein
MSEESGKSMNAFEKLARFFWVSYLILALPLLALCVWGDVLIVREWLNADSGYAHKPSTMILAGFALMPFVWIGGVLVGHRFNGGWLATLPFAANLVVMSCIAHVLYSFMRAEHNDWDAEFLYVAGLIAILCCGLSSAIATAWRSKPPQ